ncbi:uncharacterized protein TNCV_2191361 [Trichonephila clavipes]|nr:uncharacterized protein TNCV_2191361 [Trichonephila clavipes]
MQYQTCARNSVCSFCNIVGVTDQHAMLIRLSKSDLLVVPVRTLCYLGCPRGLRSKDREGGTPADLRSRLFECQMSVPKMNMVAQICVRGHHHAGTTCLTYPIRKLYLLKNRLTVQIKFPCMNLMLKVHRNTLGQLRCSSVSRTTHSPTNALGGDSIVLDVGFRGTNNAYSAY